MDDLRDWILPKLNITNKHNLNMVQLGLINRGGSDQETHIRGVSRWKFSLFISLVLGARASLDQYGGFIHPRCALKGTFLINCFCISFFS